MHRLFHLAFAFAIATTAVQAEPPDIEILQNGQWSLSHASVPNFGLSNSQVKVRFNILNPSSQPVTRIVEVETPWMDSIEMQTEENGPAQRAGDSIDFKTRSVFHRNPAFIVSLEPLETKRIYLTIKSRGPIVLPVSVWAPEEFATKTQIEYGILGFYFGAILSLLIYNLVLFSIGRDLSYFYYCVYLVSVLFSYLLMTGFIMQFWKHDGYWLNNQGLMVLTSIGFAGMCGFNRRFLDSRTVNPRLDSWIKLLAYASVLQAMLSILIPYQLSVRIINVLLPLVIISLTINALLCALRGVTLAGYFLFAWLTLIAGSMVEFATNVGLIPVWLVGRFGIQLGTFVEVILFSAALGKRIRTISIERTRANLRLKEIAHDLELARHIQNGILPAQPPALDSATVASAYLPLRAVGGDFYDFHYEDERHFGVLVADVTGHGIPAALDSSTVKIAFRNERHNMMSPNVLLTNMSRFLKRFLDFRFVSACYLYFDLDLGCVMLGSAGHPAPILHRNGELSTLEADGPLLGLETGDPYATQTFNLREGDRIVIYTDGVYEDWPELDDSEETRARYQAVVGQIKADSANFPLALIEAIRRLRRNHPFSDDVTVLSVDIVSSLTPGVPLPKVGQEH
ncbi:MAG: SpoIIE family protein phosphatase [Spirochaetia bacterium]|nr:SpoIIE family protein phosphatase [Spirochaetia bacterium]